MGTARTVLHPRPLGVPYWSCVRRPYAGLSRHPKQHPQPLNTPPHSSEKGPKRKGLFRRIWGYVFAWEIVYLFVYEPLRDRGAFDVIAQSTIFRIVGPKRVRPKPSSVIDKAEAPLYQPIVGTKEIRLLTLEPGQRDDEIKCRLSNVKLSWRTRYEALSYTWGDPKVTAPIKVSGHDVEVTANLHSALKDLRHTNKPRYLWVDAVCINQADLEEKAHQIMLMGSIYSHARQVLIYLGPASSDSGQAIESIKYINSKMLALHIRRYETRLNALGPWGGMLLNYLPAQKPLPAEFDWQPVISLLQRPWFQRTWVIQEAILAQRGLVICGDKSVPWLKFERVSYDIYMYHHSVRTIPNYDTIDSVVRGLTMMRLARVDHGRLHAASLLTRFNPGALWEYSKLLDLIVDTRRFSCTESRDKIYGLLGITYQSINNKYITPNYSLSVEEVFKSFVLWEVLTNSSLRVLGLNSDKASTTYSLPSWAPDFTRLSSQEPLLRRENRITFRAAGNTKVDASVSEDGTTLSLRGQVMDRVHTLTAKQDCSHQSIYIPPELSERVAGKEEQSTWYCDLQKKREWLAGVLSVATAAFDRLEANKAPLLDFFKTTSATTVQILGKPRRPEWEMLWRTLTCDHNDFYNTLPSFYREWVIAYTDLLREGLRAEKIFIQKWLLRAQQAESGITLFAEGRRFAGTDGGLIGWVPADTMEGDVVVIPYGSRVPLVVRSDGKGKYRLVGDCYIHGLMDGQAINAKGREERETVISLV
ncbi:heterokaryon incompatibility protein-domain-containing protein [Nemania abortiva]|nr:heterokaryon incompatibility protein-domain-containing protein [Nemania abortiva]